MNEIKLGMKALLLSFFRFKYLFVFKKSNMTFF